MKPNKTLRRRNMLALCAAGSATLLAGCHKPSSSEPMGQTRQRLEKKRRYLIVVGASGGASIIDSFLAVRQSEAGAGYQTLNCFPDQQVVDVAGSPFRAVNTDLSSLGPIPLVGQLHVEQESFVKKHMAHMMVATQTGTSVNHAIAQRRSVSGGGVWGGRTLQEAVANEYGADQPLANVSLTSGTGFALRGNDDSLPDHAYPVAVADPVLWALGLHGSRGIREAPSSDLVDLARALRDDSIDPQSSFYHTFQKSPQLKRWMAQRTQARAFEEHDLITALNMLPDSQAYPLSSFGLDESPDGAKVREAFPNYDTNPVEAQAALAFLLLKNDVSSAVTLAPTFNLSLGADLDLSQGIAEGAGGFRLQPAPRLRLLAYRSPFVAGVHVDADPRSDRSASSICSRRSPRPTAAARACGTAAYLRRH